MNGPPVKSHPPEYEVLLQALDKAVLVSMTDAKGDIIYANDKFVEVSKYSREMLLGQNHRILKSGLQPQSLFDDLWATISTGCVWRGEIHNRAKDGSLYWVDTTISPILGPDGKPQKYISIRFLITDRKIFEKKVQVEQKKVEQAKVLLEASNKELEAFSYSVSHDLQAPLRALSGFAQALLEDYNNHLDENGRRYLAFIQDNAHKMGQLIKDLLSFSRLGRQELQATEVNMQALAKSIFEEITRQTAGPTIQFILQPLPAVHGDPAMIRQVWMNLLSNAVKFTRRKETPIIEVGCEPSAKGMAYYVKDNGVGFDRRYIHKLFGVFQRLHSEEEFEGTGVGLALVQRVIARHGGQVWANGDVDQGATFYFTLG